MSDKPNISVKLNDRGQLEPVTSFDAEQLAQCSRGQSFSLSPTKERSLEQHKLYWSILHRIVKATGRWATADHCHRELKLALGYYETIVSQWGGIYYHPDSTALKKMDQKEFNTYFDKAMEKLNQTIGFDPMEVLK